MTQHDQTPAGNDDHAIAAAVRDFYERHPYPGPPEALDRYHADAHDPARQRAEHHLRWPRRAFRDDHAVLIAGCGTLQAVKHAMRWPRARIVGTDISEASLSQALALKAQYRLENLELRQLPLERSGELDERFDEIVCTGVLHHLPDPDAGLAALRGVLAPGGALQLMLYAPYGRIGVYLMQEFFRRLGTGTSEEEIDQVTATLRLIPRQHPIWPLLKDSPDFRYRAGLADALLHPQDRPYSVPQMLLFIARNGLRFGRWLRQAPYLPQCGAIAASPQQPRLAGLDAPDQHAAMELFRGNMVRHNAIAYRDDEPAGQEAIGFGDARWLEHRPLRLHGTVCVEEQLPAGAAGVLLNRHHTDTDLYLPVDASERNLWAAIDGKASARELLAAHAPTRGAALLELLWRYDQIVFDAT